MSRARTAATVVFALAALVAAAACGGSSKSGSSGTTDTSRPQPVATTVPGGVELHACAPKLTSQSPDNTDVAQFDRALVPISSDRLRVCHYSGSPASGPLPLVAQGDASSQPVVSGIERTGNAFKYPAVQNFMCPAVLPTHQEFVVATFADSQHTVQLVVNDANCPAYRATNGVGAAFTSKAWFDALTAVAATH